MKILVPVKRVVDANVKIHIKNDGSGVDTTSLKMAMNPFDEIALEEALRLKEKGKATEIVAVSIGNVSSQETLRHALALGADKAILIQTEEFLYPLFVAKLLKSIVIQELPQMVILGKQAIDSDNNQVGQMLAGLLNWPQATFISKLKIENNEVIAVREIDGGLETLALQMPSILTTDLRLNTPRYISLPQIVKAKQKPLITMTLEQLGHSFLPPKFKIMKVESPPPRKSGIKVTSAKELVEKLKKEAKVI